MSEHLPISRRKFLHISSQAVTGVVACGILASLGLNGCSPTPKPSNTLESAKTPKLTNAPEEAITSEPTKALARTWPLGDVPRNRTLNYNSASAPAAGKFNPFTWVYDHQNGSALLYEPCAFYAAHADKEYLWLAESYKYNADATELDITFRNGIKWSDGIPFTADDVVWSMTTLKDNPDLAHSATYVAELDKIEKIDNVTVKVRLKQTDWRFFFNSLTFRFDLGDDVAIQAPQMYKNIAEANGGKDMPSYNVYDVAKGWPISTGPYGVGVSTKQITNYDLRPTWWAVDTGFVPAMPDIWRLSQTLFANDTSAAQKLINNEIDAAVDLRPLVVTSILAQAADHLTTWTGTHIPYGYIDWWPISIWFTTVTKPWDNPDVRWAVAYAIDQQAVVDIAWGGAGLPSNKPFPSFALLNKYMDSIKDLTDQYNVLEFNLAKSAALMQKAGFTKDKDGWWVDKDGVKPDADLYAGLPLFGDLGPVVVSQLRAAGFDSTHRSPPDVWTSVGDGRANLHLYGNGGSTKDPYDTLHLYRKAAIQPLGVDCGDNRARWTNPDFEAAMQEMHNTSPDDPKMYDLFHKAMKAYYTELPDCPLVQWFHRIPVNTTYWTNWPDEKNPYMNSALWHLTAQILIYGLKATGAS